MSLFDVISIAGLVLAGAALLISRSAGEWRQSALVISLGIVLLGLSIAQLLADYSWGSGWLFVGTAALGAGIVGMGWFFIRRERSLR